MNGPDPERVTWLVRISGRVQGVWYRGWTVGEASALGLDGWVRNRADGTVEALFEGAPGLISEMIERCRQGPPAARVDGVSVETQPPAGLSGFLQLPTK